MKSITLVRAALVILPLLIPAVTHAQPANYLMKGSGQTVYFNGSDGKRYFFPNESVFKSWYADFTTVSIVSDSQLASIPLAGNVIYRPGSVLVKITTDPKVYAVSRYGILHWITSEQVATALYGTDWNTKVVDVPDAYFTNYIIGYAVNAASEYSKDAEWASVATPGDNIRTPSYVPPSAPAPAATTANPAKVSVTLSTTNAVQNQTVFVYANVTLNTVPITKVEIRALSSSSPLATCLNATACSYSLFVQTAPLMETYYAVAYDLNDGTFESPVDSRPTLTVSAASNQVQLSATPQSATVGSRVSYSSQFTGTQIVSSHKVFALIPGETVPVLWKDCGATATCASSSPFYRTTNLYSQVAFDSQTYVSPTVNVQVLGDTPKPTLAVTGHPAQNQVEIAVTAPYGETIGETLVKDGTTIDGNTLAICTQSSCSVTLQVNVAGSVTAFTWVGGKYEKSNTITVAP